MITTLLVSAVLAAPQAPKTSGIFMDVPTALTRSGTSAEVHVVGHGQGQAVPALAYDPNWSLSALLGPNGTFELNSFSTGRAYITHQIKYDQNWTPSQRACADLEEHTWSFILYSVGPNTAGKGGSIYRENPGSRAGDIFSRILEGSEAHMPSEYVGVIDRARAGATMGVSDLRGLDSYGYAQLTNPQVEGYGSFYFTLTADTVAASEQWGILAGDRKTSTIFVTTWNGQGWDLPIVFRRFSDLGIAIGVEIDALTVDPTNGAILLSTNLPDLDYQMWFVKGAFSGPYYDKEGVDLYCKTYLELESSQNDDIDAFCADDPRLPELGQTDSRHQFRTTMNAFPLPDFGESGVNCAAHRISRKNLGQFDRHDFSLNRDTANPSPESAIATLWSKMGNSSPIQVAQFFVQPRGRVVFKRPWYVPNTNGQPWVEPRYYWTVSTRSGGTKESRHFQFVR